MEVTGQGSEERIGVTHSLPLSFCPRQIWLRALLEHQSTTFFYSNSNEYAAKCSILARIGAVGATAQRIVTCRLASLTLPLGAAEERTHATMGHEPLLNEG
jgi:hypothetical protein